MAQPQNNCIRGGQVMSYSPGKRVRRGSAAGVTGGDAVPSVTLSLAERSVWCGLRLTASEEMVGKIHCSKKNWHCYVFP